MDGQDEGFLRRLIRSPRAFLFRTAINLSLNAKDRQKRAKAFLDTVSAENSEPALEENTPESVFIGKQAIGTLGEALKGLSQKQKDFHDRLLTHCHVKTIVSNSYEEVVIALHEHYKEVMVLPAIADKQEEDYDFSTNRNPKHWIRKLKNKTALLKECDKRGIIIDDAMTTLNAKIVEALIAADSR